MKKHLLRMTAGTLFLVLACSPAQAAGKPDGTFQGELLGLKEHMAKDAALADRIKPILREAERICALSPVHRAFSLKELRNSDLGRMGSIDGRTPGVEKEDAQKAELFALAMADVDAAAIVARELPLLSAVYVLTGEQAYLDRVVAQLREVVAWAPLQRPGWTLYTAANALPPSKRDGVWLATGLGMLALSQTLQVLPAGTLPADLEASVRRQLENEALQVQADWKQEVPWFVKKQAVGSNQWVVPSAGLVLAGVALGRESHAEPFELGMANLMATLGALGSEGAVSEGAAYAAHWTAPFLYLAARAAGEAGDDRLDKHVFLKNFPRWIAAMFQPGESIVNSFDNFGGARGGAYFLIAEDISRLVALSRNPELLWILRHQIAVRSFDLYGLLVAGRSSEDERVPPGWGVFDRARSVVWRDSWKNEASGVWIRGGHELDGHDHYDRGHVNFIVNGKTVLMEAATPGYSEPRMKEDYQSVKGHNVLQVGDDLYPVKSPASLQVVRLDASGGEVSVDAGLGYPKVSQWKRHIVWTSQRMEIVDEVTLKSPEVIRFRWHLGSEINLTFPASEPLKVEAVLPVGRIEFPGWIGKIPSGIDWVPPEKDIVATSGVKIQVEADQPIICSDEKNYDHALKFRRWDHRHTTLVVRSQVEVSAIRIRTVVEAQ